MPTAAKMVAALCLAVLGFVTSELIKPLMPAATDFGYFSWVNTGVGFVCGWIVIGNRAGRGMSAAVSNGLTGTAALVFWGLFIQAANEMTRLAMRHRYDGPVEALAAVFEIGVEYGSIMVNGGVIMALLTGAVLTGLFSEFAARHWR